MTNPPNTRDPLRILETRQEADELALEVYGPSARSLGYRVTVKPFARAFGIFLVVPED